MGAAFFTSQTLTFLKGLARNNNKPWFEAHRADYEHAVRDPMRALVEELDVRMARLAPEIVGDPRHSVFRIYRDVRFSADKSPYKTHVACWLYHRDGTHKVGQESHGGGAGFYFHVQPGSSLLAGGIWMPPREALGKIRDAIAEKPGAFEKLVTGAKLARRFGGAGLDEDEGGVLSRVPRGWAPDHPAARWLKFKTFTLSRGLADREVLSPRLPAALEADFALLVPLVRWLNAALGLQPAARR